VEGTEEGSEEEEAALIAAKVAALVVARVALARDTLEHCQKNTRPRKTRSRHEAEPQL